MRVTLLLCRNALLTSNQNLRRALAEVLKTTAAAEETLGLHMQSLSASGEADQRATWEGAAVEPRSSHPAGKLWGAKLICYLFICRCVVYFAIEETSEGRSKFLAVKFSTNLLAADVHQVSE